MLRIAVCGGTACRARDERGELLRELRDAGAGAQIVEVRCLGVCSGPVVVLGAGTPDALVVRKVRGRRTRRDAVRVVLGQATPTHRLRERRVRGGAKRHAVRRVSRSMPS